MKKIIKKRYIFIFLFFTIVFICLIFFLFKEVNYRIKLKNDDNNNGNKNEVNSTLNIEQVDDDNASVIEKAFMDYKKINENKNILNILALSDLQFKGEFEENKFDLEYVLKSTKAISLFENMDFVISIGDLNNALNTKEISLNNLKYITNKYKKNFSIPTYFVLGNHDRFIKNKDEYDISKEEYYNITFSDINNKCNFNKNVLYEPYYFFDIPEKNSRICILNSFSKGNYEYVIDKEQLKFIAETMLDFSKIDNPQDWTISFFIHTLSETGVHNEKVEGEDELLEILYAYRNGYEYVNNEYGIDVNYSNISRANISAVFTGHHHLEYTVEKKGTMIIGIGSILANISRGNQYLYSKYSDYNSDLNFEIISIDLENRIIYSTKVGNGQNRFWSY